MSKICIILLMQLAFNGAFGAAVTEKINETLVETVTKKVQSTISEAVTVTIIETTASTTNKVEDRTEKLEIASSTVIPKNNCKDVKCPTVPKHYEEMGCEALKDEGNCCATSFKCPDLTARDITKCYYKNEVVNATEYLQESALTGVCAAGCYCRKGRRGKPAELQCASIDCPEIFAGPEEKSAKCIKQYNRSSCCSVKSVCDDDVNKLTTCEFEGQIFREGQKIYPNNRCYECYCTNNFNNKTSIEENPNCHKIECGITLRNSVRLMDGCVPVYHKQANCCPIGWRCPNEEHLIESVEGRNATDLSPKCLFGKKVMKVGEVLELEDDECQKCTCTTPPMLHCIDNC